MPPKGWRKNGEASSQPHTRLEPTLIEEILFPKGTIQKLAKLAMPDDSMLGKDSLTALQRGATVFVLHLLFQAREILKQHDRKNVSEDDILRGLERAGFQRFVPDIEFRTAAWDEKRRQKKAAGSQPVVLAPLTTALDEVNGEGQRDEQKDHGTKMVKTEAGAVAVDSGSTDDEDGEADDDVMEIDGNDVDGNNDDEVEIIDDDDDDDNDNDESSIVKPSDVEVVEDLGGPEADADGNDDDASDDE